MTLEERYNDHAVFVWTDKAPIFGWRYTIDSFEYVACNDACFKTEQDALLAGRDAARLTIARRRSRTH